mmetsp:Transcript_91712/g.296753  ORF Transcript_91712/g.296753 Transcript_91712/m.296753 type:complete len:268 (+) Transcript_91712:2835-3638(+)
MDGSGQDLVDLLLLPATPSPLDPRGAHVPPVLLGRAPANDAAPPRLDADGAPACHAVELPRCYPPRERLQLHRGLFAPALLEVHAGLLGAQERLDVARKEADGLVHVPPDLAPPIRLDEGGALDQQLEPCKLDPFEGRQLEEDQGLADCPGQAVLGLGDVELRGQVLKQLLRPDLAVVQVLEAGNRGRRGDDLVVVPTLLMVDANGVAGAAHLNHLQNTPIPQLLRHGLPVVTVRLVLRVWLDATDEMWLGEVHNVHEARELILELR